MVFDAILTGRQASVKLQSLIVKESDVEKIFVDCSF